MSERPTFSIGGPPPDATERIAAALALPLLRERSQEIAAERIDSPSPPRRAQLQHDLVRRLGQVQVAIHEAESTLGMPTPETAPEHYIYRGPPSRLTEGVQEAFTLICEYAGVRGYREVDLPVAIREALRRSGNHEAGPEAQEQVLEAIGVLTGFPHGVPTSQFTLGPCGPVR